MLKVPSEHCPQAVMVPSAAKVPPAQDEHAVLALPST